MARGCNPCTACCLHMFKGIRSFSSFTSCTLSCQSDFLGKSKKRPQESNESNIESEPSSVAPPAIRSVLPLLQTTASEASSSSRPATPTRIPQPITAKGSPVTNTTLRPPEPTGRVSSDIIAERVLPAASASPSIEAQRRPEAHLSLQQPAPVEINHTEGPPTTGPPTPSLNTTSRLTTMASPMSPQAPKLNGTNGTNGVLSPPHSPSTFYQAKGRLPSYASSRAPSNAFSTMNTYNKRSNGAGSHKIGLVQE